MTSYQISGCSLVRLCQARRADWLILSVFIWTNSNFYPVFTRKSGHCLQSKVIFILILSNMFPILLSDDTPFLHYCICFVVSEFYVQQGYVYCLLCLSDWKSPLRRAGCGLTKGTASNEDLRSQKLHSEAAGEARGGCGGEWSSEINSSSRGISLTAERSGGTSNCHPVLSHRFPPRVNHS